MRVSDLIQLHIHVILFPSITSEISETRDSSLRVREYINAVHLPSSLRPVD